MTSYILYTNNNESTVGQLLSKIVPLKEDEEIIIFDNRSTDDTVPLIVSTIGINFKYEDKYKFYINSKKRNKKETVKVAKTIAKGKVVVLNERKGRITKC